MRTLTYQLRDLKKVNIEIGFEGENNRTQVRIDCGEVFAEYPNAAVTMKVQAPKGGIYPATVTRDGDMILWTVRDCDVANKGNGEFQLTFTDGTTVIKTCPGRFHVDRSLKGSGTAPSGVQDWLDRAEDALEQVESAEIHQPMIGLDGYWYKWDQEEQQYVSTGTKAQGEDGDPGQPGTDATPDLITVPYEDLTFPVAAGTQCYHDGKLYEANQAIQTSEQWTAAHWQETTVEEQLNTVKSALTPLTPSASSGDVGKFLKAKTVADGKVTEYEFGSGGGSVSDVKVNNVSVLDGTVAKIPLASSSTPGVVKVNAGGLQMVDDTIKIAKAQDSVVKAGTVETAPIVPANQHTSAFYALAKLAGVDLANETVTLGKYPQSALIAIQKMLGIYEAPWELIREDAATNETDANIEITVDGNGNPFELTDVRLLFCSPVQETQFVKGDYGKIKFGYGTGNDADSLFIGAYTQAANAARKISYCEIEQKNGMIKKTYTQNSTNGGNANIQTYVNDAEQAYFTKITGQRLYNKVIITNVTGTATFKLYGKRKWN